LVKSWITWKGLHLQMVYVRTV